MKKHILSTLIIGALSLSVQAAEKQKLSLMLVCHPGSRGVDRRTAKRFFCRA